MSDALARARPRTADRVTNAVVLSFAGWTLLTQLAVALGLGLDRLIGAAGVALAAGLLVARSRPRGATAPAPPADTDERVPLTRTATAGVLAVAALAVALRFALDSVDAYALCGLALTGALLWRSLLWPARPDAAPPAPGSGPGSPGRGEALVIAILALVCAAAVALAHREDADDAFYLNLVVAAIDHPERPLLAFDTLHGIAGVEMTLPVFKVLSYEMLQAAIGRLTGVPALILVQVVVPPLVACLIPIAWSRLLRLLLPGRHLLATALVVAWLVLVGDGRASWGDFAILRLHQGKALLLAIALPLISAFAIEFARSPSRARWLRLAAAQIAAVGLSSSGLWLAPAVAGLALVGARTLRGRSELLAAAPALVAGLAASAHPIGLAVLLRGATERAFRDAVHPLESLTWTGEQLVRHAESLVLGQGVLAAVVLFALLAAPAAVVSPLLRRQATVFVFAFLLVFWNTVTAPFIAANVAGPDTYFRVFWLLPVPVFVAALLSAPAALVAGRAGRAPIGASIAVALLGVGALALAARPPTLGSDNRVRLGMPAPKVPADELATARAVASASGPGDSVLAPPRISRWIPLLHDHPSPLVVREMYVDVLDDRLGGEEIDRRMRLTHMVGGGLRLPDGEALLRDAIERYPLAVVCLGGRARTWPELRRVLEASPLALTGRDGDFEIWTRRVADGGGHAGGPVRGDP